MHEMIKATRNFLDWCCREYPQHSAEEHLEAILDDLKDEMRKGLTHVKEGEEGGRCPECACPWSEHTIPVVSSLPPGWLKAYYCSGCGTCQEEPPEASRRLTVINPWQEQDNEAFQADTHREEPRG